MEKLVSIIVPVYNSDKYLNTCLNSIINQTYKNLEIILVDDGSNDSSLKICNHFSHNDKRIKVIHKINEGVSSARNAGLKSSNGEYILFVDADDYIELDCIEKSMKIINKYNLDILKFNYQKELGLYSKKNKFITPTNLHIEKKHYNELIYKYVLTTFDYSNIWNALIRKEICQKYKFDKNLVMGEDYLYFVKCLTESKNIYFLNNYFYHYVVNNESITHKFNIDKNIKKLDSILAASKKIKNILKDNGYINEKEYINQVVKNIEYNILNCIETSNYKEYCLYVDNINNKYLKTFSKKNKILLPEINKLLKKNKGKFYIIKFKLVFKKIAKSIASVIKIK